MDTKCVNQSTTSCCNKILFFSMLTLVSPAIGATLQTFLERSVLMTELFPTLG